MSSGSRGPATAGARVLGRRGRVVVTRDDGAGGPSLAGQAYASSPFTLRGKTIGSRYVYLTLISQARPRCCWPTVRPRRSTQRSRRSPGAPDLELLAYQYLPVLRKIAEGSGSQVWMIPSELTKALEGFASAFGSSTTTSAGVGHEPTGPPLARVTATGRP